MNQLLVACARAAIDPGKRKQLAEQAKTVTDWSELLAQAESHGLSPLLYV